MENFDKEFLKNEAPLLSSIPKQQPFSVPEGYFENFSDRLMEKLPSAAPAAGGKFWGWGSIAAVIALVVLFGASAYFVALQEANPSTGLFALETLSNAELLEGLEGEEIDEELLVDAMGDEALADLVEFSQVSDEAMNWYLDDANGWGTPDYGDLDPELLKQKLMENEN